MLKPSLFITGTDTNVGKTIVSALFMSCLKSQFPVKYFKPVQTGDDSDTDTVKNFADLRDDQVYNPVYKFRAPMSPDRAAALENSEVSLDRILSAYRELTGAHLVIEGAGGLEVPLNDKEKISDLMARLGVPAVLVSSTRLGTINHTLLSVKLLKNRGIPLKGIVLVGEADQGLREVFEREGVPVLFELPWSSDLKKDWPKFVSEFSPIAQTLLANDKIVEKSVEERDQELIWHPYTQHGLRKDFPEVRSARGADLELRDGTRLIDAISSWWVTLHGHAQPEVAKAIAAQAHKLEHVIFAGYTHEPAVQLAEKLLNQVRAKMPNMAKVFFSDNGSTSVEVAMKMAYQAQKQRGETHRERFLALSGSYHGDTLGAMSASDRNGFHKVFTPLMAPVDFIEPGNIDDFEKINLEEYAACIVEPLVQGAGGMRFYSPEYLRKLSQICRQKGIYLIADEVFTGFYRTGQFLASDYAEIHPDFVCLSKGISGGFLPLAVTLTTQDIFKLFESPSLQQAFLHGHSYTANPVACAAAVASFDLLMTERCQRQIEEISQWTKRELEKLSGFKSVKNIRHLGTLGAFDVDGYDGYFSGNFSKEFSLKAQKRGVLLRPLGGTVYTLPPYCANEKQLVQIYNVIRDVLREMEIS